MSKRLIKDGVRCIVRLQATASCGAAGGPERRRDTSWRWATVVWCAIARIVLCGLYANGIRDEHESRYCQSWTRKLLRSLNGESELTRWRNAGFHGQRLP